MTKTVASPASPHRLANGDFATTVGATGAGGACLGDFALTRWTPDRTRDADGVWLYVRDLDEGTYWSAGLQPVPRVPDAYQARVAGGRVELARRDGELELTTEICVAPEGDAELRRYTIVNHGARPSRLDLTTYAEAVLNTPAGDWSHPAFSKLFVQTEYDAAREALVARRRLRSPEDEPLWLVHRLVGGDAAAGHETDRMRFVGRGRTTADPRALEAREPLSGTTGNVLDPVLCLRRAVTVAPGATVRLLAVLGGGHTRAAVDAVAERYATVESADDAFARTAAHGDHTDLPTAAPAVPSPARERVRPAGARDAAAGDAIDEGEELFLFNGHGGFTGDGREYVIRVGAGARDDALPPLPWVNVVANESVGFIASERGAGYTWAVNSRENRVTPWYNDPVSDPHGEALYLRDEEAGVFWSPLPGPVPGAAPYEVRHGFGYTTWRHRGMGLDHEVVQFVPRHDPVKLTRIRLTNRTDRPRRLTLFSYAQLVLGVFPHVSGPTVVTDRDEESGALLAMNPERGEFASRVVTTDPLVSEGDPPSTSCAYENAESRRGRSPRLVTRSRTTFTGSCLATKCTTSCSSFSPVCR